MWDVFFYFCQSLWWKVQELGLTVRYKNNIEFQLHIKSHMALAFLPDADVPGIFDDLRKDCDEDDIGRFLLFVR